MTYSRTLDCLFTSIFDPGSNEWVAIKVYRCGNSEELCRFATEEEADDFADAERDRELADNGQFGVGA